MKDVAAESALIRNADTISRGQSHFKERDLLDAAQPELRVDRSDQDLLQSVDRIIERGHFRESVQFPGYVKTDLTDRQTGAFAKAATDPSHTNPRVTKAQLLDSTRDMSNPMDQAQRFSIVDASARGGVEQTLNSILTPEDRENTIFVHGERSADIARFPVGTDNLHNVRDFLRTTRSELASKTPADAGYGPQTTLVVSDTALRSAHRAELVGQTAAKMQVGKVIILAEPDKSHPTELAVLSESVRRGAVSELSVTEAFVETSNTTSLEGTLRDSKADMIAPVGEGLEMAAARHAASETARTGSPSQLVTSDPLRLENLNKAAQVIQEARHTVEGGQDRPGVRVETFSVLPASEYNAATGAGIRQYDVIQIRNAPEGSGYSAGERYPVRDINPIESNALVKNPAGDYVRLPLEAMARQDVQFDVLTKSETLVREGDPISIQTAAGERVTGLAADVSKDSFSLALSDGRSVGLTPETAKASDLQAAFATSTPALDKPGSLVAVAGVHDRTDTGLFNPGASYGAARAAERDGDRSISVFTSDPVRLASNSARTEHSLAQSLQQSFERSLGEDHGAALPDVSRGDEGR